MSEGVDIGSVWCTGAGILAAAFAFFFFFLQFGCCSMRSKFAAMSAIFSMNWPQYRDFSFFGGEPIFRVSIFNGWSIRLESVEFLYKTIPVP